jgi:C4-type Zn-finger protein
MEEFLAELREREIIRCPHCREVQMNDDNQYPVTYHGEDETMEWECDSCGENFYVEEVVTREYRESKTLDQWGGIPI